MHPVVYYKGNNHPLGHMKHVHYSLVDDKLRIAHKEIRIIQFSALFVLDYSTNRGLY